MWSPHEQELVKMVFGIQNATINVIALTEKTVTFTQVVANVCQEKWERDVSSTAHLISMGRNVKMTVLVQTVQNAILLMEPVAANLVGQEKTAQNN